MTTSTSIVHWIILAFNVSSLSLIRSVVYGMLASWPSKALAPEALHHLAAYWPFQMCGIDFIGPISPHSSEGHKYILTVGECFTKWAKAIPV